MDTWTVYVLIKKSFWVFLSVVILSFSYCIRFFFSYKWYEYRDKKIIWFDCIFFFLSIYFLEVALFRIDLFKICFIFFSIIVLLLLLFGVCIDVYVSEVSFSRYWIFVECALIYFIITHFTDTYWNACESKYIWSNQWRKKNHTLSRNIWIRKKNNNQQSPLIQSLTHSQRDGQTVR